MDLDYLKKEFVTKYVSNGRDNFYKFLLIYSMNKIISIKENKYKGISPELELLNYYEQFLILYRREGDFLYIEISRLFRKAAHKVYRVMLREKLTPINAKFLNLV